MLWAGIPSEDSESVRKNIGHMCPDNVTSAVIVLVFYCCITNYNNLETWVSNNTNLLSQSSQGLGFQHWFTGSSAQSLPVPKSGWWQGL